MCNACGMYCCAYDGFSGCGCEGCPNPACWPDFDDEDDPANYFYCEEVEPTARIVNVGDELHQALADALAGASTEGRNTRES
jgi:hypothetical protein